MNQAYIDNLELLCFRLFLPGYTGAIIFLIKSVQQKSFIADNVILTTVQKNIYIYTLTYKVDKKNILFI